MKINDYVDKVYMLSLKGDYKRRINTSNSLNLHNIQFEICDGIYGKILDSLVKDYMFNYRDIDNKSNTLGCALTHLNTIYNAYINNYKRILILEDDLQVHKDVSILFKKFYENNKQFLDDDNYDIIYLGYTPLINEEKNWSYGNNIKFLNENTVIADGFAGGYAYIINRNTMVNIIKNYKMYGINYEVDSYMKNFIQPMKRSYAIAPQIFCCSPISSSRNNRTDDNSLKNRSIFSPLAKPEDYS